MKKINENKIFSNEMQKKFSAPPPLAGSRLGGKFIPSANEGSNIRRF